MNEKIVAIGFRGTEEYRAKLARAALDRKVKVQALLEKAVDAYLAKPEKVTVPKSEQDQTISPSNNTLVVIPSHKDAVGVLPYLSSLSEGDLECVRGLIQILRFGDKDVRKAILSNVAVFLRLATAPVAENERGGGVPAGEGDASLDGRIEAAIGAASAADRAAGDVIAEVEADRSADQGNAPGDRGLRKPTSGGGGN